MDVLNWLDCHSYELEEPSKIIYLTNTRKLISIGFEPIFLLSQMNIFYLFKCLFTPNNLEEEAGGGGYG